MKLSPWMFVVCNILIMAPKAIAGGDSHTRMSVVAGTAPRERAPIRYVSDSTGQTADIASPSEMGELGPVDAISPAAESDASKLSLDSNSAVFGLHRGLEPLNSSLGFAESPDTRYDAYSAADQFRLRRQTANVIARELRAFDVEFGGTALLDFHLAANDIDLAPQEGHGNALAWAGVTGAQDLAFDSASRRIGTLRTALRDHVASGSWDLGHRDYQVALLSGWKPLARALAAIPGPAFDDESLFSRPGMDDAKVRLRHAQYLKRYAEMIQSIGDGLAGLIAVYAAEGWSNTGQQIYRDLAEVAGDLIFVRSDEGGLADFWRSRIQRQRETFRRSGERLLELLAQVKIQLESRAPSVNHK